MKVRKENRVPFVLPLKVVFVGHKTWVIKQKTGWPLPGEFKFKRHANFVREALEEKAKKEKGAVK